MTARGWGVNATAASSMESSYQLRDKPCPGQPVPLREVSLAIQAILQLSVSVLIDPGLHVSSNAEKELLGVWDWKGPLRPLGAAPRDCRQLVAWESTPEELLCSQKAAVAVDAPVAGAADSG